MPDPPGDLERERQRWRELKRVRPREIETPGQGQESVWDYPRPPRVEPEARRLRVELAGVVVAESTRGRRVIETASPPVYYMPPADVRTELLEPSSRSTFCEWKGIARHWSLRVGDRLVLDACWSYPEPDRGFGLLKDWLAFYPGRVDTCHLGDDRVSAQPGGYYGGWITAGITGPFKGGPDSESW